MSPRIEQVVHPDVVFRNVLARLRLSLSDAQVHVRRNPLGEAFRQSHFRPLPARPCRPILETFVERGQRKIQQHHKSKFVLKQIIHDVRRRIIPADNFVKRKHRAEIEIHLLAEFAVDLVHVAAKLFQQFLQAVEHGVQRRLISRKVGAHEFFEDAGVAILRAPELGCLMQASFNSRTLRLPVLRNQFVSQFRR